MGIHALSAAAADLATWTRFAFARWRDRDATPPAAPLDEAGVRRLGLAPLLYRALRDTGDDRADRFAADHRHAATASLIRLTYAARLRDRLESTGIPVVLLKGGAFLVRFAPADPGVRPMSDLDWLVPADRFRDAVETLRSAGFDDSDDAHRISSARSIGIPLTRRGAPMDVEIDLHRALALWPLHRRLTIDTLRRSEPIDGWRVPSLMDALALAGVHRARHAFVWGCLDLVEIRMISDRLDADEWTETLDHLTRTMAAGAVYASFRQAVHALGDAAPLDHDRLHQLGERLRPSRRAALDRLAAIEGVFLPPVGQERPLSRNFVVQPAVSGSWWQSAAAAAVYLPLRAADEWRNAGGSAVARAARVWQHLAGAKPSPLEKARTASGPRTMDRA